MNAAMLNDMKHANSDAGALVRSPLITDLDGRTHGEYEKCSYAFFPGCQLGSQEPEVVVKVFDALLFQNPDTAIFLYCCGKPVLLGSDKESDADILTSSINDIRNKWEELGKPMMIMACPACIEVFAEYLPEIPLVSLYEMLEDLGIGGGCNSLEYAIHHPETASEELRKSVETLAEDMGVKLNKEDSDRSLPIITYGIMIRNAFKAKGRDSAHILELMFGMGASNTHLIHTHEHDDSSENASVETCEAANDMNDCDGNCADCSACPSATGEASELPGPEQCRANREELKEALLALYWDE